MRAEARPPGQLKFSKSRSVRKPGLHLTRSRDLGSMTGRSEFNAYASLNPPHVPRVLVPPQRNAPRVPQVPVRRPTRRIRTDPTSTGVSHGHPAIFSAVNPSPLRPLLASGRLTNGHSAASRPRNLLKSSSLEAGVKPFRVRAA